LAGKSTLFNALNQPILTINSSATAVTKKPVKFRQEIENKPVIKKTIDREGRAVPSGSRAVASGGRAVTSGSRAVASGGRAANREVVQWHKYLAAVDKKSPANDLNFPAEHNC